MTYMVNREDLDKMISCGKKEYRVYCAQMLSISGIFHAADGIAAFQFVWHGYIERQFFS